METISIERAEAPAPPANSWLLFVAITAISSLLVFAGQHLLLSDELYFNALSEQMTFDQINTLINQNNQHSWVTYVTLAVFNLLKFILVAACLSLGYYFVMDRWLFKPFFRVAIRAELILLLPAVIKLFWFLFVQTDYSLYDLQYFYPLSLLNLIGADSVSTYLIYPLQLANLFELAYWFTLAYGVSEVIKFPMSRAFGLVAAYYGAGLLIWVSFIMFILVSLS